MGQGQAVAKRNVSQDCEVESADGQGSRRPGPGQGDGDEADDKLIEKYLEGGDLSEEEINQGLQKAIAMGLVIPVLCGSGAKNVGVAQLLDLITTSFPSPGDRAGMSWPIRWRLVSR
jgi:peptide subunit release factor RF-3